MKLLAFIGLVLTVSGRNVVLFRDIWQLSVATINAMAETVLRISGKSIKLYAIKHRRSHVTTSSTHVNSLMYRLLAATDRTPADRASRRPRSANTSSVPFRVGNQFINESDEVNCLTQTLLQDLAVPLHWISNSLLTPPPHLFEQREAKLESPLESMITCAC